MQAGQQMAASARVVHELSNLLDGSLRNVELVISNLQSTAPQEAVDPPLQGSADDREVERLLVANQAMRQMASLLRRWMHSHSDGAPLYDTQQHLDQAVLLAARLLRPAAAKLGVEISVSLPDFAGQLPAGPAYTIVSNALRNSIQAIADTPKSKPHSRIDVTVKIDAGFIELCIQDEGPGLDAAIIDEQGELCFGQTTKPHGHGIGLAMIREIVHGMGGALHLSNRSPRGARLVVRYPLNQTREQQ